MPKIILCFVVFGASLLTVSGITNLSTWVFPGAGGRMIRPPDAWGNRVLDYSGVGYRGGTVPIPDVPVKVTVSPVAGDAGASIQAAINTVKALALDANGFRGAVLLTAGEYQISNSIIINASGIVLRGVGDATNGTILRAAGTNQRTLIIVSGSGSLAYSGSTRNITSPYVPVGARSFNVDSTGGLAVGNRVMIKRPSTANWIQAIGMDLVTPAWTAGAFDIYYDRMITCIEGLVISLDEPIACALEQQYGGGTIRPYSWSGIITNVGIEGIRGVSDYDPAVTSTVGSSTAYPADENHGWIFIEISAAVADAWVRNVTAEYFGYACVRIAGTSASEACTRNITVRDCNSLDPVSVIDGGRRYAFVLNDCHHVLIQNCHTRKDRHQFVTQSLTPGPNVFVDGLNDSAYNECGPHFRWGTGAIWDNVTVNGNSTNGVLAVRNRGDSGTSHGWAGANEVVWNSRAGDANGGFTVESPPTARNWLIGSIGKQVVNSGAIPYPAPAGTYDSPNTNVFPNSLYYAQLQDRLAAPNLQTREYWLGVIDGFTNGLPRDIVALDSGWSNTVQSLASGQPLAAFNVVNNNHWIPFTFNFPVGGTDQVVAATLSLALRASNSAAGNAIYLASTTNSFTFSTLGWLPLGTGTNTTVRVLNLDHQLNLLTNGQFNVAVQGDAGIDWALLELQVAPVQTLYPNSLLPVADAFVRGGTNAGRNYGPSTTLEVQADSATNNQRQAYLRWNLTGYPPGLQHVRIRLTPMSVGTNGLEHGITLAANSTWSESTINWSNQPVGGKRFATWIPAANVPVEFVVTPQVQAVLAGDGQLALELFSLNISNNFNSLGLVSYASSEDANPACRPQLLLVYSNAVAPAITTQPQSQTLSAGAPVLFSVVATNLAPLSYQWQKNGTNLAGATAPNYSIASTQTTNAGSYSVVVTNLAGTVTSEAATLTVLIVPPQFTQFAMGSAGAFTLAGTGPTNEDYRIFTTTNLTLPFSNWTATTTGIFSGGLFIFTDPPTSNSDCRFYRVTTP